MSNAVNTAGCGVADVASAAKVLANAATDGAGNYAKVIAGGVANASACGAADAAVTAITACQCICLQYC